jgi:uncharacterized membrane protein YjgN (DUF898 family)
MRAEFTGSAAEYFRIWIVNLFFTLITLGVYSAWAKVRKKRYFYGCTRIDGDSFDYFGSPKAILKGRILAVLLFLIYVFVSELYPSSRLVFIAVFVLALPWLVVRALAFNARNSAYRGLRFDFAATPREAVPVYLGIPLLVLFTAGIAYPFFAARNKVFVVSHHALGTSRFGSDLGAGAFFKAYILAGLMLLGLVIPIGIAMGFLMSGAGAPEGLGWARLIVPMILMYAAYAVAYAYIQARTANLLWNSVHCAGLRFASTLKARTLLRLYVGNVLAVIVSAGLLIPWAVIRTLRYRLESLSLAEQGQHVHEASPALERVGATGQEFGDIFNVDLGL